MIDSAVKNKNCTGCHACFSICPNHCISMVADDEGFWYPKVDCGLCNSCGLCIDVCPILNRIEIVNEPKAYACINKDETIRLESSSGGIFTTIAEEIINSDGVVFGAGFDRDFNVVLSYVENKEELDKFRGSKYVQSKIGNTYEGAKYFLDQGRNVLYTGTPCQIAGFKSYLGKAYENLFCMDNICHGVPSPKVWKRYVSFREEKASSPVQRIAFRRKDEGWKRYSVSFEFQNDTEYRGNLREDLFMRAFLKDVCLRSSCYDCKFKTLHRQSDITLADFWGIQRVLPEMDDDKGTSLIFVNTLRGQAMLDKIKHKILYKAIDINEAVSYNSAAIKSVECNHNRQKFLKELDELPFDSLVKKYCTDKVSVRIKRRTRRAVKKLFERVGVLETVKQILGKYRI